MSTGILYNIINPELLSNEDWEHLTELTHDAYSEHKERDLTMLSVSCSADFLKKRCIGHKLIIARSGDEVAGYCCFTIQNISPSEKALHCITLAIHSKYKRRGISKKLHQVAIEQAKLNNCAYAFLDTSCNAPSARAAHHAAGYKDWYYTHFPNANYYSIVMRHDLQTSLSYFARMKSLVSSWLKIHLKMDKNGRLRPLGRFFLQKYSIYKRKSNLPIAREMDMELLTLRETQKINLNLLNVFSEFCERHGLRYLLCYGTLIGAVRHNGFIPWDDDIDVTMPMPDYYKFRELFEKENKNSQYGLLYGMKYNVGIPYTMLGDMRTIANMPGRDISHSRPVAIDILPCYALSDDDDEAKSQINNIASLVSQSWKYLNFKSLSRIKSLILPPFLINKRLQAILSKIDSVTNRYKWGETKRVRTMAFVHSAFVWLKAEDFDNYISRRFEQYDFRIPTSFHEQLTAMYGNYMELPPLHQRHPNYSQSYINRQ